MRIVVLRAVIRLDTKAQNRLGLVFPPNANPKALGRWLRRLRRRRAVSLEGIAAFLGCSEERIEQLEQGDRAAPVWMVALYLEALGFELVLSEVQCCA